MYPPTVQAAASQGALVKFFFGLYFFVFSIFAAQLNGCLSHRSALRTDLSIFTNLDKTPLVTALGSTVPSRGPCLDSGYCGTGMDLIEARSGEERALDSNIPE
ncbi:MAG: hypothetical protein EOP10_09940 [Proteobacteria bacterium]|nr:MAG: hypothetical protein EOP10_09940 [Pseudomonadota bacterium]